LSEIVEIVIFHNRGTYEPTSIIRWDGIGICHGSIAVFGFTDFLCPIPFWSDLGPACVASELTTPTVGISSLVQVLAVVQWNIVENFPCFK
jgi:hypothetical protein